jgi:hypothetical protein
VGLDSRRTPLERNGCDSGAAAAYAVSELVWLTLTSVRSLFYNHPAESPKKGLDVRGPAFRYSAIKFNRDSLPTSFAASSVKDDFNSSVTGKTLFHRLERPRLITRNDKKIFL